MSSVTRLFDNREHAMGAVAELKRNDFTAEAITVVGPAEGQGVERESAVGSDDAIVASIMRAGVSRASAEAYADGVRRGGTVVSVRPRFGFALAARAILDQFNSTYLGASDDQSVAGSTDRPPPDPAAPLSSAAGWPVLSQDPTPLSSWLGWRTLSQRQTPSVTLSDEPAPLSQRVGVAVLAENAAPLSRLVGLKVLLDRQTPWSTLSDNPAPLSSRLRLRLLWGDAAPLSSWLGWRVLLHDPAPLSSWLRWRVLSRD